MIEINGGGFLDAKFTAVAKVHRFSPSIWSCKALRISSATSTNKRKVNGLWCRTWRRRHSISAVYLFFYLKKYWIAKALRKRSPSTRDEVSLMKKITSDLEWGQKQVSRDLFCTLCPIQDRISLGPYRLTTTSDWFDFCWIWQIITLLI